MTAMGEPSVSASAGVGGISVAWECRLRLMRSRGERQRKEVVRRSAPLIAAKLFVISMLDLSARDKSPFLEV